MVVSPGSFADLLRCPFGEVGKRQDKIRVFLFQRRDLQVVGVAGRQLVQVVVEGNEHPLLEVFE
jgi:hypothetical protein